MILLAGLIAGREERVTVKRANRVPSVKARRSRREISGSSFTGSIRTLKAPAQVNPISKASSSPSSARNSRGSPVRATSSAASITCASMQPPIVTAPLRLAPPMISIFEPSFLGAVPSVAITVARQALELSFAAKISSQNCFMIEKTSSQGWRRQRQDLVVLTAPTKVASGNEAHHHRAAAERYFRGSFSKVFLQ